MARIRWTVALTIALALAPSWRAQESWRDACIQRCVSQPALGDPEVQRQEIISLEKEAARAIQQGNGTFFHRVYSDDFGGTLSHGQQLNKDEWIATIESPRANGNRLALPTSKSASIRTPQSPLAFGHPDSFAMVSTSA